MPSLKPILCVSPLARCPPSASSHFGDAASPTTSPLQAPPPTEVVPRLYIGDLAAAESPETLAALKITHVLSVMPGHVALPPPSALPHLRARGQPALERMQLPLTDTPFAELAAALPHTTAFLAAALAAPHARVLVHCVQGISRSASVVAAYLVASAGCAPGTAVRAVQAARPCAQPNPGFLAQLDDETAGCPRQHASYAACFRSDRVQMESC
ncbi:phosphatases II [Epithele typhae]|uniref:phosphatases II n=1 Tax=Epithele typhae TaxID=378194 RepID=UPI002007EF4D|nr:phosphatases II [Epithele typhae]KAH9928571.1 phosphatases II [Epithele typhae]